MRRVSLSAAALLALPLFACSAAPSVASSDESAVTEDRPHLLALGDSITFAWNPFVEKDLSKVDPTKYHGFAEDLGEQLNFAVDNGGCPGEASGSVLDATAEDNGCRQNRATYKLHDDWHEQTQIEFATDYLTQAVANGKQPALVTMTMGGNDLLLLQKHCNGAPGLLRPPCQLARLPFYVHDFGAHIEQILKDIDATGYTGTMVLVTTYAPDYSDPVASFGLGRMNDELREHAQSVQLQNMKVKIADAYAAFQTVASQKGGKTCETGLLIANGDGTCDIHPTAAGHALIAQTIRQAAGL